MSAPSKPSEWTAPKDEVVELPSGKKAKLKGPIKAMSLMRHGVFSPEHLNLFAKAQAGALDPEKDDLQKVMELNDLLLREMFVEPQLFIPNGTDEAPEDAVHIDLVDDDDAEFVLERAWGVVQDVATFRSDRDGDGDGPDGTGVEYDPIEPAGDGAGDAPSGSAGPKPRGKGAGGRGKGSQGSRKKG